MQNYTNLFKNIFLVLSLIVIFKLYNEKNELRSINQKLLKKQRKESELIVDMKLKQIDSLKQELGRSEYLIDEALNAISDLQNEKRKVEKVYVEKVNKINTFDANQLKNYFNEELN
jgi:cell division protein ZapA (FtsZ GTPase activity inhibitor)